MMNLTRKSPLTGKDNTLELDVTPEEWRAWDGGRGPLIQRCFPRLSDDEREFILTGCLPGEFDTIIFTTRSRP